MLKVKFHQNFDGDNVYVNILKMTPNCSGVWKNMKIVNDDSYDFFVILNHPQHSNYDPKRTIVFECETKSTRARFPRFYQGRELEFFHVHNTEKYHNLDFWYHGLTYDQLEKFNYEKNKSFSIVNSFLGYLPGHIARNQYINKLHEAGISFDLYGRYCPGLPEYKGSLQYKYDGLVNYKYTFNCENDFEPNYFTEKSIDGILCECLTFYDGCPNISDFIDERAIVKVDVNGDVDIVRNSIDGNLYESRLPYIKEEKKRLMNDFNLLEITRRIIG